MMYHCPIIATPCQVVCDRSASVPIRGEWVTFLIRKSVLGRSGWKIMTENENMNLRLNRETIEMVTEKIRWREIMLF